MRAPIAAALVLLAWALVSCGFRLEGHSTWPDSWPGYRIQSQLVGIGGETFVDALQLDLEQRGVSGSAAPAVRIRLIELAERKLTSALDASGRAAEFELQRQLRFQLTAGEVTSQVLSVVAQRRLSFDPALALAKQQEEAQIKEALVRELINLLLLRSEAELRVINRDSE